MEISKRCLILTICTVLLPYAVFCRFEGIERTKCKNRELSPFQLHSPYRHRLYALRKQMDMLTSLHGSKIEAYILTSFDEYQNEDVENSDKRREYLTGFTGSTALVVITQTSAALWTDDRYLAQADSELDCDWKIFKSNQQPNIPTWIASQVAADSNVGADPHIVPHYLWNDWETELHNRLIRLNKINKNLIDEIWKGRPHPINDPIYVHPIYYAGEKWESKIATLRSHLVTSRSDAIIVTSLTEIAYLLNLRGSDLPYTPVFKAYLLVTSNETNLYTNQTKINLGVVLHLKAEPCFTRTCVRIKDTEMVWHDIRTLSRKWRRIITPSPCVFDHGVSEAIYTSIPRDIILDAPSPVILMKAQKNEVEREGMRRAHITDGAAMCDTLSYIEQRYTAGDILTEMRVAAEIDRTRRAQQQYKSLSRKTIAAYGSHGSFPHFEPFNSTDIEIADGSTLILDSGGQYLDGTTKVTRTIHLGEPTAEQKAAYTNVLRGIIHLSSLVFPETLKPAEVDALIRGPLWGAHYDYPQATGHGIGSFSSVRESPINIAYSTINKYTFRDGYFFSNEPGFYKHGDFGIRIENILEVVDTGKRHTSGSKFLAFKDVTLVPYEAKLIDRALLSTQEKKWLNDYNAKIRELVGEELKKQINMQAFYWMMNKTRHIIEYLPENEYRRVHGSSGGGAGRIFDINSNQLLLSLTIVTWLIFSVVV